MSAPLYKAAAPLYDSGEGVAPAAVQASVDEYAAKKTADAAPANDTSSLMNVVSPDGETYSLPASQVEQALSQGYKLESAEGRAVREYIGDNKGLSGTAKVFLRDAIDMMSFGVSGTLEDAALDPLELAKKAALERDHHVAGLLGSGVGLGVSLFYGGELGDAGGAASLAERLILGGGEKAAVKAGEEALTTALVKAAPAGMEAIAEKAGPGLARKLLASGGKGLVEGAMYSAPKAVTEAALGDPNQAAETLLYGAGAGALFGAGMQGLKEVAGGVSTALGHVMSLGRGLGEQEADFQGGATSTVGKAAEKQAFRSLASNQASLGAALKKAGNVGGPRALGRELLDEGLVRNVGEAADAYAERIAQRKGQYGEMIGGLYRRLDELGGEVNADKIAERIRKEVLAPLEAKPGFESIAAGVKGYLSSFESKVAALDDGLSFEELHKWRAALDDLVWRNAKAQSPVVEELRDVRRIIQGELESQGDRSARAVGEEFLAPLRVANTKYARLNAAQAAADDYVMREAKTRFFSPTDYGVGVGSALGAMMHGNPLGALMGVVGGVAHHIVRTEGNALLARALNAIDHGGLIGIERSMAAVAERLDVIPRAMEMLAVEKGAKKLAALFPHPRAADLADHEITRFVESETDGGKDRDERFDDMQQAIMEIAADPAHKQAKIAQLIAPLSRAAPSVSAAYAGKLTAMVDFLASQLPKSSASASPFDDEPKIRPSDAERATFAKKAATALDPFSVIPKIADGTISDAEVTTLKTLYPMIFARMQAKIVEGARPLPYGARLLLGRLFDVPLDRSVLDVGALQGIYAGAPHPAGGPGGMMPPSASHGLPGRGKLKPPDIGTSIGRISAR